MKYQEAARCCLCGAFNYADLFLLWELKTGLDHHTNISISRTQIGFLRGVFLPARGHLTNPVQEVESVNYSQGVRAVNSCCGVDLMLLVLIMLPKLHGTARLPLRR
jgi:hypothetical protein